MTSRKPLHWIEYLCEGLGVALLMAAVCAYAAALQHPASPLARLLGEPLAKRCVMAVLVALTSYALICSPWGQRSGAHFNPAVTLTYFRLGKVAPADAVLYVLAQFGGGVLGVTLAVGLIGSLLGQSPAPWALTAPGLGEAIAFAAEVAISFALMATILVVSNTPALARRTPLFSCAVAALFVVVEAPLSGSSMNPARSFAPALGSQVFHALWVYLTAPPLGMLLAGEVHRRRRGPHGTICAKLHHHNAKPCIFNSCGYRAAAETPGS